MGELTLLGTAATGAPLAWVSLCAQDVAEGELDPLCTTTDDVGDYQMLGLFHQSGLLETSFTHPATGQDQLLYSLYDLTDAGTAARANINPTTDIITRAYLAQTQWSTPADCFDSQNCVGHLDDGLNTDRLELIKQNLETLLGPAWPQGGYAPITDRYIADPSRDELDKMHDEIRFEINTDPDSGQEVLQLHSHDNGFNCIDQVLTALPLSQLSSSSPPEDDVILTEEDYEMSVQNCRPFATDMPYEIDIDVDPSDGSAPLSVDVAITVLGTTETVSLSAELINPRGQVAQRWTTSERALTLTDPGRHRVSVRAVAGGVESRNGAIIEVDGLADRLELATWGQTGSCFPDSTQLNNFENFCLEKLDGSIASPGPDSMNCSSLTERPELTYGVGICSEQEQYGGQLLGICRRLSDETRLFYYRNEHPNRASESAQQQHDRNRGQCQADGGDWRSML